MEELQVGTENELFLDMFVALMRLAYQRKIKDLRKWIYGICLIWCPSFS